MALIALHSAATGLSALSTSLDITAHNLANANTDGFKASRANFQDLIYLEKAQPGVENANGDQRPFVSALVVLDPDAAAAWCVSNGVEFTSLAELATHPAVVEQIDLGLEEVMAGFNNAERVKKVTILGEEWLPDSEELTPTSKLKRRGIHARFADEIEAFYA